MQTIETPASLTPEILPAQKAAPRHSRAPLETFLKASGFPSELASFVKYEFDKHLYYYGAQFSNGYDRVVPNRDAAGYQAELIAFFWKHQPTIEAELAAKRVTSDTSPCVFSTAYFGWERGLAPLGVRLLPSPWIGAEPGNALGAALLSQCRAVQELLRLGFSVLYHKEFHSILRSITGTLEQFFALHPAAGMMMPYTNGFFEGISTSLLRSLGKPTFLCIHGIPQRFDWWARGEHATDYIVVWGEAMKRRLIETGRKPESILVSGHPDYSGKMLKPLRSSLERVLVLGSAQNGAPQLDLPYDYDRSLGLDYLWRVQCALKSVGVNHAKIRPHPCESAAWYRAHLDPDFYSVDESPSCADALAQASIVVGPTSTVLVDAAVSGLNYVSFLPSADQYNVLRDSAFEPDIPFDGSDARFPVARTEEELAALLRDGAKIDLSALSDYLSSHFRPEVVLGALNLAPRSAPAPAPKSSATVAAADAPKGAALKVVSPSQPAAASLPALHIPEASESPATQFELQVLEAVRPFTMTPPQVTLNAMRAVAIAEERKLKGAIVECGVWRGGVSMAMMLQLKKLGGRRNVFLYDTFDGMSAPTEEDLAPSGESASKLLAEHRKDEANHYWAYAPIDRVRKNVESVGYPMDLVRMIQGKVEDTIPGVIPDQIAVLRLDTDWYESTRHELIHLYPRLISGGILILDDYGFWQGARKAVDEFLLTLPVKPKLNVVHDNLNSCVRWAVKP